MVEKEMLRIVLGCYSEWVWDQPGFTHLIAKSIQKAFRDAGGKYVRVFVEYEAGQYLIGAIGER